MFAISGSGSNHFKIHRSPDPFFALAIPSNVSLIIALFSYTNLSVMHFGVMTSFNFWLYLGVMLYILEAMGAIELSKVLMNVFCEYLIIRGVKYFSLMSSPVPLI